MREALAPQAGETLLEVGPGTGYYTLEVARSLAPSGTLHICDLQQDMLDHTIRRAFEHGVTDIEPCRPTRGACRIPTTHSTERSWSPFSARYPNRTPLSESCVVVKRDGRIVVGELLGDPHMVGRRTLERRATASGFAVARYVGRPFGYFAVLRASNGR